MSPIVLAGWLLGTVAVIARLASINRDQMELLSPLTFVVCGFFWLYVVGYVALEPWSKALYLSEAGYVKVVALASLSAKAFGIGFRRAKPWTPSSQGLNRTLLRHMSLVLIAVGALGWAYFLSLSGGFVAFYGSLHGAGGAWEATTAYVYATVYFLFAGTLLLLSLRPDRHLTPFAFTILLLTLSFLIFDAWVTGTRGDWLRLVVIFGVYHLLLRRRRLPKLVLASLILGVVVLLVLTPYLRSVSYIGAEGSLGGALATALEPERGIRAAGRGNELVFAAALVQAAWEQGAMDYGLYWLHPFVNVIPRIWWPEKPYVAEFSVPVEALLWRSFGWVQATGAAPTGLADAFLRLSWASPIIWFLLGVLGGKLFKRVRLCPDLRSAGYLTAYLIGLIYAIVQDFTAAIYASMYVGVPLYIAYALSSQAVAKSVSRRQA